MHAGIDPRSNGGIAILSKTIKLIAVHDMPKMKHESKTISDPVGIPEILKGVKSITLEEVGSRPPPVRRVHVWNVPGHRRRLRPHSGYPHSNGAPQDWQGFFRLKTGEKDIKKKNAQIAAKTLTLYPTANLYGPKGGLRDGRSDALLIARWGYLKQPSGEL